MGFSREEDGEGIRSQHTSPGLSTGSEPFCPEDKGKEPPELCPRLGSVNAEQKPDSRLTYPARVRLA